MSASRFGHGHSGGVDPVPEARTLLLDVYIASAKIGALVDLAIADTGLPAENYALHSLLVDEGPATPTELAARTGIALSTVVFRTRKMIAMGHLERSPTPPTAGPTCSRSRPRARPCTPAPGRRSAPPGGPWSCGWAARPPRSTRASST